MPPPDSRFGRFIRPIGRKFRVYLIKVGIFFVIGITLTQTMERISLTGMQTFNESVNTNVKNWNPWQLSKIYYGELLNGGIYSIPGVKLAHRIPPADRKSVV